MKQAICELVYSFYFTFFACILYTLYHRIFYLLRKILVMDILYMIYIPYLYLRLSIKINDGSMHIYSYAMILLTIILYYRHYAVFVQLLIEKIMHKLFDFVYNCVKIFDTKGRDYHG